MLGYSDLGNHCHWCGDYVTGRAPKTGKHVFCRNGGKCKMAHKRAYDAYRKNIDSVTPRSAAAAHQVELPAGKGNVRDAGQAYDSLPAISVRSSRQSNARKRGRKR